MVEISLDKIKELREKTGVGVMICREVLGEVGGDLAQAEKVLLERAAMRVESRSGRETANGVIGSYIHAGGKIGAMIELRSETDFVSRSPEFGNLVKELSMQVCAMDPTTVGDLLEEVWIRDPSKKVGDLVYELGAKTKENIVVKKFCRFEVGK